MNAHTPRIFHARIILLAALILGLAMLWGCAKPQQGPSLPAVSIGLAEFTQPQATTDMLAGYMPENTPRVAPKELLQLTDTFIGVLRSETKRSYASPEKFLECREAKAPGQKNNRVAALKHWVAVGNCMEVDFLVVPQVMQLREREGGTAGVASPAGVVMDIFLVDVKNGVLTSRSHFEETQLALADNLLETGKFFSRGGKWITAVELAREGMVKAVKDLGL